MTINAGEGINVPHFKSVKPDANIVEVFINYVWIRSELDRRCGGYLPVNVQEALEELDKEQYEGKWRKNNELE